MFYYIKGLLTEKTVSCAIIDAGGVGYELSIPISTYHKLPEINNEAKLYTYLYVREDIFRVYGFYTKEEKQLFLLLLSISGLGPKTSLSILSGMGIGDFKRAILDEDIVSLTKIPGIGKKTAERIFVEMKSKVDAIVLTDLVETSNLGVSTFEHEAVLALMSLGYSPNQAKQSYREATKGQNISSLEVILKRCLLVIK